MNVWSLNKHSRIKSLLLIVQNELGLEHFCIDDNGDNGFSAISLASSGQPELRAYVYVHGQAEGNYGIHLEYPRFVEQNYNESMLIYEDLTLKVLINTIATHFELASY